jgi:hypothetical protein
MSVTSRNEAATTWRDALPSDPLMDLIDAGIMQCTSVPMQGFSHSAGELQFRADLGPRARRTDDDIDILPARVFAERLWAGQIVR